MGAAIGRGYDAKKKKGGVQVNKSNSYPITKRNRRQTLDVCSHLDLEVTTSPHPTNKRATANIGAYRVSQQHLADLKLGETIRKGGLKDSNGLPGYDISVSDKPAKKKGSKLNIFNSVRGHHKAPPAKQSVDHSPDDASYEVENSQLAAENGSTTSTKEDDLSNASKIVSFSEDSEDMASSVSSSEPRDSFCKSSFIDFDNVIGYNNDNNSLFKLNSRQRGRSVSDSLFHHGGEGSRESTISEIQRAKENEKKKNKRFQELTKILSERNIIIELHELSFTRKVGEGAFSEVWEGNWNGVLVAIKKLKSMVDDALFQERFLREVENLRKGNHQNVVMFFGVCLKPPCIVTEFMGGGNLYDLLHKSGVRLSTALVTKMATDLAVGLLHLHSLSILHRDLTSLNILLDELGNVKISDFGLSREKQQEGSMTMTLGGICNPRWRPPEITKNLGHYSEKVDVYSFALVVWEMLTGEIPFANLDGPQAAAQVAYTNLRPVIPPNCPAPLRGLIQRCWDDDAKSRPDFKDIVEELRAIQFSNPMGFASELH